MNNQSGLHLIVDLLIDNIEICDIISFVAINESGGKYEEKRIYTN